MYKTKDILFSHWYFIGSLFEDFPKIAVTTNCCSISYQATKINLKKVNRSQLLMWFFYIRRECEWGATGTVQLSALEFQWVPPLCTSYLILSNVIMEGMLKLAAIFSFMLSFTVSTYFSFHSKVCVFCVWPSKRVAGKKYMERLIQYFFLFS